MPPLPPIVSGGFRPGVQGLPDGWRHIYSIDLTAFTLARKNTLSAVPFCIKPAYSRILTQVLTHIAHTHKVWARASVFDDDFRLKHLVYLLSWRLFIMLPQLILFKTVRGGSCGERNLKQRIALLDSGEWGELMVLSENASKSGNTRAPDPMFFKLS